MTKKQKSPQKHSRNFWSLIYLAQLFFVLLCFAHCKLDLNFDKIDDIDVGSDEGFVVSEEIFNELIFIDNSTSPVDNFEKTYIDQRLAPKMIVQKYYRNQVVVIFEPSINKEKSRKYLQKTFGLQKVRGCPNCGGSTVIELWGKDGDIPISPEERDQIAMSDLGPLSGGIFTAFNYIFEKPVPLKTELEVEEKIRLSKPGNEVLVALIDTGIDFNNKRLKKFEWNNVDEFANLNNDDDGNCIEDDDVGYDFVNNRTIVKDKDGHGTHLAGIIGNIDLGTIGKKGNQYNMNLKLMNLKIFDGEAGNLFNLVCALQYAVDKEVDIINLSLGFYSKFPPKSLKCILKKAESKGILIVSSAGNDGLNNNNLANNAGHYPSSFNMNNMIAVSALNEKGNLLWSHANYGINKVDVAAPGEKIISTYLNGGYAELSGTSMAAGFVTKVAALYMADNPSATALDVKDCIINKAISQAITSSRTVGTITNKVAKVTEKCN